MTRSERHIIYEGLAFLGSGCGLAFAVPTLISAQDSIALLSGLLLGLSWLGWGAFFIYRMGRKGF